MRLIPYIRVSRVAGREGDTFISPAVQRETIARHARGHGHELLDEALDLDQPGSRDDRPAFQQALAAVERGEADGIIVAKLDRFARSVAGAARALERLEAAGGTLVSVDLGMDTSTPAGRLMRNVLTALAEFELDRIRESWEHARDRAIARGVHISRVPPVGYLRGEDGRLRLDPVAAPIVREVFRRRAEGESWDGLCAYLDTALPRENGGWTRQTVGSLIARRTYLGEAFQGDVVNAEAHDPLVTRAEWEAAQSGGQRTPRREDGALLAGLLRCAACGYAMTRQSDGRRAYHNYKCRVRHSAGICPDPAKISERRANEHIERLFLDWLEREGIAAEATATNDTVAAALAQVEAAEAELVAYRDAGLVTVIGREAFVAGLGQRQQTLDDARRQLDEAQRATVPLPPGGAKALIDEWPTLTTAEKGTLIAAAIDAVAVRRADLPGKGSSVANRMHVFWRGEAPTDLPGRSSSGLRSLVVDDSPGEVRAA